MPSAKPHDITRAAIDGAASTDDALTILRLHGETLALYFLRILGRQTASPALTIAGK